MGYSIEPKDRIYEKGYEFFSFAKNMSSKYSQRPLDSAKKSTNDAIKTASKTVIQKTVEATIDLIGNKTAEKIKVFQKSLLKNCTYKMRIK